MLVKKQTLYEKNVKRVLDVVLCSFAMIVLSPVFLVTAIAIKISSPGPILYYSLRQGKNKIPFRFYKFRSMHVPNGKDKGLCIADEDRLFTVGRIIRRLKIDELPQLLNVIKGDMSIVGPRPMAADSIDDFYSGRYESIASVKPGLTSAASLYDYTVGETIKDEGEYRKSIVPVKLEMELLYVQKQSFLYDSELVLRTVCIIIQVLIGKRRFKDQRELKEISRSTSK